MYLTVLPLDADFNEDEVQNFDLDYFDDTVHEPIYGVCDQADYNPAPTDFDASFDPVLGLTGIPQLNSEEKTGPILLVFPMLLKVPCL